AGQLLVETRLSFLARTQLAGMEAVLLAGAEALVVGLLADGLELLEGDRLHRLERHFLDLGLQLGFGLFLRLGLRRAGGYHLLRVEARQQPALERRQVAGADQIAFVFALARLHDSTLAPPGVCLSRTGRDQIISS